MRGAVALLRDHLSHEPLPITIPHCLREVRKESLTKVVMYVARGDKSAFSNSFDSETGVKFIRVGRKFWRVYVRLYRRSAAVEPALWC